MTITPYSCLPHATNATSPWMTITPYSCLPHATNATSPRMTITPYSCLPHATNATSPRMTITPYSCLPHANNATSPWMTITLYSCLLHATNATSPRMTTKTKTLTQNFQTFSQLNWFKINIICNINPLSCSVCVGDPAGPLFDGVGLAGFKSRANALYWPKLFAPFLSSPVFIFSPLFLWVGIVAGVNRSLPPALQCLPFNNNNKIMYNLYGLLMI